MAPQPQCKRSWKLYSLCKKEQRSPVAGRQHSLNVNMTARTVIAIRRSGRPFLATYAEIPLWPRSLKILGLKAKEQTAIVMMNEPFCGSSKSLLKSLWVCRVYDAKRADDRSSMYDAATFAHLLLWGQITIQFFTFDSIIHITTLALISPLFPMRHHLRIKYPFW